MVVSSYATGYPIHRRLNMQADNINQLLDRAFSLVETGNTVEARALFEQVCQQDSSNAEAWMMRGIVDVELGNNDDAVNGLDRALQLDPSLPEAWYYLARIHRNRGDAKQALHCVEKAMALDSDYGEAFLLGGVLYGVLDRIEDSEQCCRKAAALLPTSPDAQLNLGNALMQNGSISEAYQYISATTQLQPDLLTAWLLLGRVCARLGDMEKSAVAYRNALQLKPDSDEAHYGSGFAAYQQNRYEDAVAGFARALEINPAYVEAANSLGTACQAIGRFDDALAAFERALQIQPDFTEALFGKASVLIEFARQPEAITCLRQVLQIQPDFVDAWLNLASALMTFSELDEALKCCEKALQLQPDNIDAIALAARIEQHAGQIEKAYQRLKPLIDTGIEQANIAVAFSDVCSSMNCPEEAIGLQEKLLGSKASLPIISKRSLHFGLGKLYSKTGDYDKAFANYQAGNELRDIDWDPGVNSAQVDNIIQVFNKTFFSAAPRAMLQSRKPVFVLGMPRSGTSLVEQILASHPLVFGAGELADLLVLVHKLPVFVGVDIKFPYAARALDQAALDRIARQYLSHLDELSADAQRVIDKMPGNFSFLGLIELLFPDARVIHCMRDPIDTCLSCYFQDFSRAQPYTYDLVHLGLFYQDYQRLMEHWKTTLNIPILDVSYEDLVCDQETVSRQMIEFLGLDWDDSCLQFHRTERFVATASYDQVRRPIYSSSVRRWEKYKAHLEPLIEVLDGGYTGCTSDEVETGCKLGDAAYQQGRYEDAVAHFSRVLDSAPSCAEAANGLGKTYQAIGQYEAALTVFERAVRLRPDYAEALFGKAGVLMEFARHPEAIPCLHQALEINPGYVDAYLLFAVALMSYNRPGEALECCEKALQLQPGNIDAIAMAARVEQQTGQIGKAYQRLKPLIASGVSQANIVVAFGDVCSSMNCPHEAISPQQKLLANSDELPAVIRRSLYFSLGKLYDKTGSHDQAFANYRLGNETHTISTVWNPALNSAQIDDTIDVFSEAFFGVAPRAAVHSQKPVFVLGMPRSGTSLVEHILASHPDVYGAGELADILHMVKKLPVLTGNGSGFPHAVTALDQSAIDALAHQYLVHLHELAPDVSRVVDKSPDNFKFLGIIELLFPDARVIHCVRDPIDTCLSCYFQEFSVTQPYSCNLEHLGAYYQGYQRLMAHWKSTLSIPILDVHYEEIVADQETESRRMIEFCNLDWNDSCLQFHKTERFVATSSYDQVRRPIYSSSVSRWEKYRQHLGPLINGLK